MLSAYIHLCLLPQVWRRLVNSAGQKFQTSTIISETKTPLVVRLTPTPATYKLTCFELLAKIDLSFPFGVAVNSFLSIT